MVEITWIGDHAEARRTSENFPLTVWSAGDGDEGAGEEPGTSVKEVAGAGVTRPDVVPDVDGV